LQMAYCKIGHFACIESGRKPLVHFVKSAYTLNITLQSAARMSHMRN
jgi:hypothetical protein